MIKRSTVIIVVGIVLVLSAWGAAYYYVGADTAFLWGLLKSGFTRPGSVRVVANVNSEVANVNAETRRLVGFTQATVASGLEKPTRMAIEPGTNDLFVSQLNGKIFRVRTDGTKQQVASGFNQLLGISFVRGSTVIVPGSQVTEVTTPTKLIVASRGTVSQLTRRADVTFADRSDLISDLPAGRHQTDLAFIGPDGKLYIATGSRSDRGESGIDPHEATILVADADGKNLRVFARGLRNPYGMMFYNGKLYVSDNGQDVPANGVPDELNVVEEGKDYGWVGCWGVGQGSDCAGTEPPVALLQEHSSANGFAFYDAEQFPTEYRGNIFIALWGANSKNPDIGKKVVRVIPKTSGLWETEDFVTGLDHPIDVKVDPRDGSLLILDFGRGEVIRVKANYE